MIENKTKGLGRRENRTMETVEEQRNYKPQTPEDITLTS